MKTVRIEYFADWNDVINVVCSEMNDEAVKLGDILDEKDIPFEYCVVNGDNNYDGNVALVLTGIEGIRQTLNCDVQEAYVFNTAEAVDLIDDQKYGQLIVNGVDYVAVSDMFQKLVILDEFDSFCRGEYATEGSYIADDKAFPVDDCNDTENISDSELNTADCVDYFADKTRLMDAAQHAAYKVYEMYEKAIDAMFAKDPNHK